MHVVPQQVINLLASSAPFDTLKPAELSDLAKQCVVLYLTAQNATSLLAARTDSLFCAPGTARSVLTGAIC